LCDFGEFFLAFGVIRVFLGLFIGLWNPVESVCSSVPALYLDFDVISFLTLSEKFSCFVGVFIAFITFAKFVAVYFGLKYSENTKTFQFVISFLPF